MQEERKSGPGWCLMGTAWSLALLAAMIAMESWLQVVYKKTSLLLPSYPFEVSLTVSIMYTILFGSAFVVSRVWFMVAGRFHRDNQYAPFLRVDSGMYEDDDEYGDGSSSYDDDDGGDSDSEAPTRRRKGRHMKDGMRINEQDMNSVVYNKDSRDLYGAGGVANPPEEEDDGDDDGTLSSNWHMVLFLGLVNSCFVMMVRTGNAGDAVTPGVSVILHQVNVPAVMVLSAIVLGSRFRVTHFMGSSMVIGGVIWMALRDVGSDNSVYSACLIAGSSLPGSLFYIGMDVLLKRCRTVSHTLVWALVFGIQSLAVWAWMPLVMMFSGVDPPSWMPHILRGMECMFTMRGSGEGVDDCLYGTCWHIGGMVLSAFMFLIMSRIIQRDSASLNALAMASAVPIANVLFTVPQIMGDYAIHLHAVDYVSIAMVSVGVFLYRCYPEIRDRSYCSVLKDLASGCLGP